jgi:hypothetical protein
MHPNLRQEADDGADLSWTATEGRITIRLAGQKLRGGYALIRIGARIGGRWLPFTTDDQEADARRNPVRTEPGRS